MSDAARFLPADVIRRKRDGETLEPPVIKEFVARVTNGEVADAQIGAFLMATFLRGMDASEGAALTHAMATSGRTVTWDEAALQGPRIDKHSTGGVGDKVSLLLAPLMAACGLAVPMISGRGLGHTGGTLDKLDAIEGYRSQIEIEELIQIVADVGCAIVGQTRDLAPADRRLYAARDITATVASIPLITASILSKKLAAGIEGLVMDVKTGPGAFLPDHAQAEALARELVGVAEAAGLPTRVLFTDMSEVLGGAAGNALEVREVIDALTNTYLDQRLGEVTFALGAQMLLLGECATDAGDAHAQMRAALADGRAGARFARMVAALGGPADILERPEACLDTAQIELPVHAERAGFVDTIDVRALGMTIVGMGGGRARDDDEIDHAVGLARVAGRGAPVDAERPLAIVHARTAVQAERAAASVRAAYIIGDAPPKPGSVVMELSTS